MGTVDADLDLVQQRLHDSGDIWPRSELLRVYNDGYRQLLAGSGAFSRLLPLDVPGRHTYAVSHSWETRHTNGGTWWFPMLACYGGTRDATAAWEVEQLDGVTPSAAFVGLTYQWERSHTTETDRHFQFGLPADDERVRRIEWNNKVLRPASVREFDEVDDAWMRRVGEPTWWTVGTGAVRSVEVYEIDTTYQQAYDLRDSSKGIPREPTGDRTYALDVDSYNPSNAYAYTTQGDAQALTNKGMAFVPASAYCHTWEVSEALTAPAYNFTINLTMNYPSLLYVVVHPWELGIINGPSVVADATNPGQRGMFAWEADPSAAYESQVLLSDNAIALAGMGSRVTFEPDDKSDGFYLFLWEGEQLNGETVTTQTTGSPIICFPWEFALAGSEILFGLGGIRSILSPDRQYVPMVSEAAPLALLGGLRDWRSSADNLMAMEVVVPPVDLVETDTPVLIPGPLQKYLRYYTLSRAFGREGEGQRLDLAAHYDSRFLRGVALLKRFADTSHADRTFARQDGAVNRARPPYVRLPSTFERVL